jgi:hypothetical protein
MALPVQQAREIFTKAYLASYKENIPVPSFLKSFFTILTFITKTISIEVQRGTERIAVDVLRGVNGNRNTFSLSSEKEWMPPFYNENFDATQLDRYDRVFGQSFNDSPAIIGYLARDVAEKTQLLRDKIDRAKEFQCAQVFETGIVTLLNGDNIDFKRKAASLVDLAADGGYWGANPDVELQLIHGAEFIRQKGKNGVPEFNLVMSGTAWIALKATDYFKNKANYNQVLLLDIKMPQTTAFGAGYMGRIAAGAYTFNVWTYDEVYETSLGVVTRYWPVDKAFIVPVSGTRFHLSHAGVPAILADTRNAEYSQFIAQIAAEYYLNNYIDPQRKAHIFEIYSAPLAIPVSVDMIYTMQVLGGGEIG